MCVCVCVCVCLERQIQIDTVRVKKNATICKICVPLFDKKRLQVLCTTLLRFASKFVREAPKYGIVALFCPTRNNSEPFPAWASNAPHFHRGSGFFWNVDSEKDGTLSGIAVHLQERWHTFTDYGTLVRLSRITAN